MIHFWIGNENSFFTLNFMKEVTEKYKLTVRFKSWSTSAPIK